MRPSSPLLLLLVCLLTEACTPRCQENCRKVLDCGLESTRVSREECVESCQVQQDLYQQWEDKTKIKAFRAHKRCIRNSSCEEIEAGECYDDELFVFDPPESVE